VSSDAPTLDPDAAREAIEYCFQQGWDDGLPVVPPTEDRVQAFLATVPRDPQDVLSTAIHLDMSCTVWNAAVNAVMAGCLPEYFPIVVATLENMWGDPERGFPGVMSSTAGPAPMVVINGPIRRQIELNCEGSLLSPGFRANATIGRTLHLVAMNVFGVKPHVLEQATQGTPCKWAMCFGENEEESPWQPLHVERGFTTDASTVTTCLCGGSMPINIRHTQQPERVLLSLAHAMSSVGASYRDSWIGVILGPEHAHLLQNAGWSKQRVKQFLWEHYGQRLGDLRQQGRGDFEEDMRAERFGHYSLVEEAHVERRMRGAADLGDDTFINFAADPESILLVVAGANNAGVSTVVSIGNPLGMPQNGRPLTRKI
jgi:hypothetical protein